MNLSNVTEFLESEELSKSDVLEREIVSRFGDFTASMPIQSGMESQVADKRVQLSLKHSSSLQRAPSNVLTLEISQYWSLAEKYVSSLSQGVKAHNLLQFWSHHAQILPNLAKLATAVLCKQATSIASERAFSSAGLLFQAKRSRLSPIHAEKLLFLHDNYELLKNVSRK